MEFVLDTVRPGDLVLTLGAGDIGAVADQVLLRLTERDIGERAAGESAEGDRHAG